MRHHRTQHAGIRLMAHAPSTALSGHTAIAKRASLKKVSGQPSAGKKFDPLFGLVTARHLVATALSDKKSCAGHQVAATQDGTDGHAWASSVCIVV